MGADDRPRAPDGLQARGRAYWDWALDEFTFSPSELQLLTEVCRTADLVERLDRAIRGDGPTAVTSKGDVRVHPAVGEARQQRLTLHKLISALKLPEPEAVESQTTLRARKAAQARWRNHDARRGDQDARITPTG